MSNLLNQIITIATNIKKGDISMQYKKESETVRAWVNQIREGKRTLKQVPPLFNLRQVVKEVLDELEAQEKADKEENDA